MPSDAIDHLLTRHVADVIVGDSLKKKLASKKNLRVKLGADPTAPDLHLGHAVALKKLKEFQDLGHQVVFIIGDYTSRIGDPSGKSKTRPMLSAEEIEANTKTYLDQVGKILDVSKVEVRRNSEWFQTMDFAALLALVAQFTVARMIERDDFEKRLKEGTDVHMHELLYPMMQAYDSVMVEADVEVGGTDQRFNMLAGRDLQRKMGKTEQDVMLFPLLVGTDGEKKMSKSLGNYIGIAESPNEMFGKMMSIPDAAMRGYFELLTDVDADEINKIVAAYESGAMNPRVAKVWLAKDIVKQFHSAAAADEAEAHFNSVFQKKEVPDDVQEHATEGGERALFDLLVEVGFATSKSDARRAIEGRGVKVDGVVIEDPAAKVEVKAKAILIQKGKRFFVKIVKK